MAFPVYSYRFQTANIGPGGVVNIPLDMTKIYVIRDCTGTSRNDSDISLHFNVFLDGNLIFYLGHPGAGRRGFSWQGHVVFPGTAGLQVTCDGDTGEVDYAISGYQLG